MATRNRQPVHSTAVRRRERVTRQVAVSPRHFRRTAVLRTLLLKFVNTYATLKAVAATYMAASQT